MKGIEFDPKGPENPLALRMTCGCGAVIEIFKPAPWKGTVDFEVPIHICPDNRWVVQFVRSTS